MPEFQRPQNKPEWKKYQDDVAALFQAAGCDTQVEKIVEGARGRHEIDVYITFKQYGINCAWLLNVNTGTEASQKKVMALSAIVADCGADRRVIISKKGFQSGAIRAANKTILRSHQSMSSGNT